MLDVPRALIAHYADQHSLAWVEDESNADSRHRRNHLRREVMPRIEAYFPGAATALARAARHFSEAAVLLEDLARSGAARIVYVTGDIYVLAKSCTLDFQYEDKRANYAYARSKLGVSWNARSMQEHVDAQGQSIQCVSVHPGVVGSELMKGGEIAKRLFLITPQKSAQSIVYSLTDEAVRGGDYIHNVRGKMALPPNDPVLQEDKRRQFWKECNEACAPYLQAR